MFMEKCINNSFWLCHLSRNVSTEIVFSNRFVNDKLNIDRNDKIIVIDGVLLNKSELFNEYSVTSLEDLVDRLISEDEERFFAKFRGPFNGFVFYKQKNVLVSFGNQTGDSSVFYAATKDGYYVSNNFNEIVLKLDQRTFNERAAHYLVTYGYMIDDSTILTQIKRVQAGKYLKIRNNSQMEILTYHRFTCSFSDISMDEAVESLDRLFRRAVKRCFEKDKEYGYTSHLVDMSAGLDSRMTNWVARDLGYDNIINISYSQSCSDEGILSQKVSNALANQFYHKSLDDCRFIYDVDELVEREFALAYYCGITGGDQFLSLLDFNKLGLEHTGQIGDAVVGYISTSSHSSAAGRINIDTLRNSNLLPLRFQDGIAGEYNDQDQFAWYTRLFQGALSTHYIRANYTYTVSPFMDVDLLNFLVTIPCALRADHRLYWQWIDEKYPQAGLLKSSRRRFNKTCLSRISDLILRGFNKLCRESHKLGHKFHVVKSSVSPNNMNPYTFWYESNDNIRNFIQKYYEDNIGLLDDLPSLKEECCQMINSPVALDKLMVLTVLSAHKIYCSNS